MLPSGRREEIFMARHSIEVHRFSSKGVVASKVWKPNFLGHSKTNPSAPQPKQGIVFFNTDSADTCYTGG